MSVKRRVIVDHMLQHAMQEVLRDQALAPATKDEVTAQSIPKMNTSSTLFEFGKERYLLTVVRLPDV